MPDEKLSQLNDLPLPIQDLDEFYTVRTTSTSTNTATGSFKVTWIEIKDEVGGGGGVSSATVNYEVADIVHARSLTTHGAGNFTTGVRFVAMMAATITGFKFAYDGFAGKTVKWTVWDAGYDGSGSALIETSTISVLAAGVYSVVLSSPLTFTPGKFYIIAIYINDGTNYIAYTTALAGWAVVGGSGSSFQLVVTAGPIVWFDVAVFASGDAKPNSGSGGNATPIQLTYQSGSAGSSLYGVGSGPYGIGSGLYGGNE